MSSIRNNSSRLTSVAREFCCCIETCESDPQPSFDDLAAHLRRLLPRLHAEVEALGDTGDNAESYIDESDMDRRFELYSRLHDWLGERDAYWMEFDVARDGQEKSGSLADDLTDIYWELKSGLTHLQRGIDVAPTLRNWSAGYRLNWGQHLVDAERHLYALRARRTR